MTQENTKPGTELQKQEVAPRRELRVVTDESQFANLLDTAKFEHLYRVADMFSKSTIIPDHYRTNVGNCFIACQMAMRLGVDPFMFMQKTYVVHGKPGMEAQLATALINTSGLFVDALNYEIQGEDPDDPFDPSYRCRAWAVRRGTDTKVQGPWVDWPLVKGEGWLEKAGSKWKTMPSMMFMYRAATFFGRMHCPERLMGMTTIDELEDIGPQKIINVRLEAAKNSPQTADDTPPAPQPAPSPSPIPGAAAPSNESPQGGGAGSPAAASSPLKDKGAASHGTEAPSGNAGTPPVKATATSVPFQSHQTPPALQGAGNAACPICKPPFPLAGGKCPQCAYDKASGPPSGEPRESGLDEGQDPRTPEEKCREFTDTASEQELQEYVDRNDRSLPKAKKLAGVTGPYSEQTFEKKKEIVFYLMLGVLKAKK